MALSPLSALHFLIVSSQKNLNNYTLEVKGAFLQAIFDQGNLSSPSVPDSEILNWLNIRLPPLLSSLTIAQIPLYFSIIKDRPCNIIQEGWEILSRLSLDFNQMKLTMVLHIVVYDITFWLSFYLFMQKITCYSTWSVMQGYLQGVQNSWKFGNHCPR